MSIPQSVPYDKDAAEAAANQLRIGLRRNATLPEIAALLNAAADVVLAPALPLSSCKRGCSYCCQQSSIIIDEADAILLSTVTGRAIAETSKSSSIDWKGVPCVFLDPKEGCCTVYEHRPLTCRLSISIDQPKKCLTEEERQMLVLDVVHAELYRLVGAQDNKAFLTSRGVGSPADIRAFFPPRH